MRSLRKMQPSVGTVGHGLHPRLVPVGWLLSEEEDQTYIQCQLHVFSVFFVTFSMRKTPTFTQPHSVSIYCFP